MLMFTKKKEEAYNNKISVLEHEIADLRQIVKTQELVRLRNENARLKEKEKLISQVKFKLKDVAYVAEDDFILVKYEIPNTRVHIDQDGNVIKNDFFYAINKLQLISFEDMKKIQNVIDALKSGK